MKNFEIVRFRDEHEPYQKIIGKVVRIFSARMNLPIKNPYAVKQVELSVLEEHDDSIQYRLVADENCEIPAQNGRVIKVRPQQSLDGENWSDMSSEIYHEQ